MEVSNTIIEEEESNKCFNIKLGASFQVESTTNSLLSFRYSNKPKSISPNSIGNLISSNLNSNGVYATFPNTNNLNNNLNGRSSSSDGTTTSKSNLSNVTSSQDHRFSGNLIKAKEVECVLIWDELDQCYVLEHLSSTVRLTYDRLPKNGIHSTPQSINSPLLSGVDSDSQSSHANPRGRTTTVAPKRLNNNNLIEVEDFGSMAITTPTINHEVEHFDLLSQDVEMRDYGPTSKTGRSADGSSRERSRHTTPLPPPLATPSDSYLFPVPVGGSLSSHHHLLNQSPMTIPFDLPTTIAPSSLHSSPAPLAKLKVKPPLKSTTAGKGPSRPTAARKGPAPSTSTSTSTSTSVPGTKKRRRSSIASKTLPPTTHYQNTSSSSPGTTATTSHSGHAQKRLPSNYNSGHPSSTGTAPNNSRVRPPLPKGTQHSSGASSGSSGSGSGSGSEEDSDEDDDDDDEEEGPEGYLVPLKVAPGSVLSRNISLPSTSGEAFSTGGKGGGGGKGGSGNNNNYNNNTMRSGKSPVKSTTVGLKSNPTGATTSHNNNNNNNDNSESQSQSEEDEEEEDDSDSSVDAHSLGKLLNNGNNGRRRSSSNNNNMMTMGTGGKGRGGKGRSVGGKSQMPQKRPQPLPSNGGGMSFDRMLDSNQDEAARRRAMEAADVPESSEEE